MTEGFHHWLDTELEVWRADTTLDAGGGQSTTRFLAGVIRARISQPSAQQREVGQRSEARITQDVYVSADADVRRGDELRGGGLVLDVIATMTPSDPIYKKAEVEHRDVEVNA